MNNELVCVTSVRVDYYKILINRNCENTDFKKIFNNSWNLSKFQMFYKIIANLI